MKDTVIPTSQIRWYKGITKIAVLNISQLLSLLSAAGLLPPLLACRMKLEGSVFLTTSFLFTLCLVYLYPASVRGPVCCEPNPASEGWAKYSSIFLTFSEVHVVGNFGPQVLKHCGLYTFSVFGVPVSCHLCDLVLWRVLPYNSPTEYFLTIFPAPLTEAPFLPSSSLPVHDWLLKDPVVCLQCHRCLVHYPQFLKSGPVTAVISEWH